MTKRPLAYVCMPRTGAAAKDADKAREYCRQIYKAGFTPICPALMLPTFLNESIPAERKAGMEIAHDLLRRCHAVIVCGSRVTESMTCEIMLASRLHITGTTLEGVMAIHRHKSTPQEKAGVPS